MINRPAAAQKLAELFGLPPNVVEGTARLAWQLVDHGRELRLQIESPPGTVLAYVKYPCAEATRIVDALAALVVTMKEHDKP